MHIHTQNKLYAATTRTTFYLYVSELLLLNRQRKSGSTHSRSFSTNGYPCQDTHIPWSPRPNLTKISHTHPSFFPSPFEAGSSQSERERERLLLPGVGRAIMVVCIIHSEGKRRPLFPDFSTWVPFRLYRSLRFFSSPSPSSSFSSSSASLDTQSSTYRIFCHY